MVINPPKPLRFWCQSVLPLVYDDSLSYYEMLCKVRDYINNIIATDNSIIGDLDQLKNEVNEIQNWIDNFDTSFIEKAIADYIKVAVFFGLTMAGYFVAYIPETWGDITFKTTGYDIIDPLMPDFGHLELIY